MSDSFETASVPDLISALEGAGRAPAIELIRACMKRRHDLTPALLDMLATPPSETWEDDDPRWYAQIHAGHLLIYFREPQAIPIFMQLLRQPDNDHIMDWFEKGLASYGLGILPELSNLLNDLDAPESARIGVTETLQQLAAEFPTERARVIDVLKSALPGLDKNGALEIPKPRPEKPNPVCSFVISSLTVLSDFSSRPQIEALYRDHWVDENIIGDIEAYHQHLLHPQLHRSDAFNIIETYEELREAETAGTWDRNAISALQEQLHALNAARLGEAHEDETPADAQIIDSTATIVPTESESPTKGETRRVTTPYHLATPPMPQQPIRRAEPKVGRNDPCPCGSGRKYKHCHGKS